MIDLGKFDGDRFIDSNDLRSLLDEANDERQSLVDDAESAEDPSEKADLWREVALWDEENGPRLKELKGIVDDLPADELCIHDNEIEDYLTQMVEDSYSLPRDFPSFLKITIDYDALLQDYTEFSLGGSTYHVRCV